MPVDLSTFELPGGTRCLRLVTSGHITKEDAETIVNNTDPGRPMFGLPQLVLTQRQESISSDARTVLAGRRNQGELEPWAAVVVTNPLVRVATNFLVRIGRNKRIKMFGNEAEGIQWLVARLQEGKAKAGT